MYYYECDLLLRRTWAEMASLISVESVIGESTARAQCLVLSIENQCNGRIFSDINGICMLNSLETTRAATETAKCCGSCGK
jgi:hypothetical protein